MYCRAIVRICAHLAPPMPLRRQLTFLVPLFVSALLMPAATIGADDTPLANGVFLVAKPGMADPNFRDTVVLITEPEVGGGPIGVIINRPADVRLSEAVPELGEVPEKFDRIFDGGPVEGNRILYLVRTGEPPKHGLRVLDDVYLSGERELLQKIVRGETNVTAFRAFAGYAGWAPDQLQAEIERDGWFVIKADADTIFAKDPEKVWPRLIQRIKRVMARAN
jgi:putative transcriptional regulator